MTTLNLPRVRERASVRPVDLVWVAWRQHRAVILVTAGITALIVALLLLFAANIHADHIPSNSMLLNGGVPLLAGIVAVFWGAPLLTVEYEQHTNMLAWTQDVRPARWLLTKLVVLAGFAVVLSVILAIADQIMLASANVDQGPSPYSDTSGFGHLAFESWPIMQVGYCLFGLALGVAIGALVRRTLPAVGLTIAGFGLVRWLLSSFARPYYLPALRCTSTDLPLDCLPDNGDMNALWLHSGFLDGAGNEVPFPDKCAQLTDLSGTANCMRANGISQTFITYQPADRNLPFHLIELGSYLLLTAGCVLLAWSRVRRVPGRYYVRD